MKNPELPENRKAYVASGRAFWHVWLPGLLVAVLLAGLMAFAFVHVARAGWHYMFITPLILVAPVAGWWFCVQYASRSRAPGLAGICGLVLGLIACLGRFHAAVIIDLGVEMAHRVDLAAESITNHMHEQKWQKAGAGRPLNPKPPGDVDIVFNWFFLVAETFVCVIAVAGVGIAGANRPFSERYQEHLRKLAFTLQPGFMPELIEAMRESSAERFRAAILHGMRPPDPVDPKKKKKKGEVPPSAVVTVYFLPDAEGLPFRDDPPAEAYLSVTEVDGIRKKPLVIANWELMPEELAILEELLIQPFVRGKAQTATPENEP